jgi:hypothetical protein
MHLAGNNKTIERSLVEALCRQDSCPLLACRTLLARA